MDIAELRSRLTGPVFVPGDRDYLLEATGFNLAATYAADAVVGAASELDVQEAVRFAAANDLPVHIQATGHGASGHIGSGVLIVTSRLDELSIDPSKRLATIGAGVRWQTVVESAGAHGLLPITGSSPNVGAIGYTLGGGLGPLARSHGFSSDYVRGFRVVLASGELVSTDADHHPDLFWALRGGKAGFGVVTSMDVELVPLTEIYGGSLTFEAEHIEAVLRGWIEWTATVAPDVSTSAVILRMPPIDAVPEPLRGKTLLNLRFADPGEHGERHAEALRGLAPIMFDQLGAMPTTKIGLIHNDPTEPSPSWVKGMGLSHVDDGFVSALLELVGPQDSVPIVAAELRHLGNRTATDVPGGSAVGGRDAAFTFGVVAALVPGLPVEVITSFYAEIDSALAPWRSPVTNINFSGHPSPEEYPTSWPADIYERLVSVTKEYDPRGRFTPTRVAG